MKDTKVRANLVIDKELKAKIEEISKKENRSFNNMVITILQKFVDEYKES